MYDVIFFYAFKHSIQFWNKITNFFEIYVDNNAYVQYMKFLFVCRSNLVFNISSDDK
jgi:hypothetical protein